MFFLYFFNGHSRSLRTLLTSVIYFGPQLFAAFSHFEAGTLHSIENDAYIKPWGWIWKRCILNILKRRMGGNFAQMVYLIGSCDVPHNFDGSQKKIDINKKRGRQTRRGFRFYIWKETKLPRKEREKKGGKRNALSLYMHALFQSWALSVFVNFFNNKIWFWHFFQVNNLFLHHSYLKSPLPVKLIW